MGAGGGNTNFARHFGREGTNKGTNEASMHTYLCGQQADLLMGPADNIYLPGHLFMMPELPPVRFFWPLYDFL